jgi:hypothetical protein
MRNIAQHLETEAQASSRWSRARLGGFVLGAAAFVLLAAGCAHKDRAANLIPPPLPIFLTGPAAAILSNANAFAANVVMESGPSGSAAGTLSGQLAGSGTKLFFAPDYSSPAGKRLRAGGFNFIWDMSEGRGWLLSDSLQGYSPISSPFRSATVTNQPAGTPLERADGHTCQQAQVTVTSEQGSTAVFQVWRATDLKGFPVRLSDGHRLTLTLSRIRLDPLSAKLFQPPEGFVPYVSPEAMMAEMAMRQANLKRKPVEKAKDEINPMQGGLTH